MLWVSMAAVRVVKLEDEETQHWQLLARNIFHATLESPLIVTPQYPPR